MNYVSRFKFMRNMQVPWIVRLSIDTVFWTLPLWGAYLYPFNFYHFGHNTRIRERRRGPDDVFLDRREGNTSIEAAAELYTEMGFVHEH